MTEYHASKMRAVNCAVLPYLSQLFTDLRHTLDECGAQDVLKKAADGYSVCMPLIELRIR